MTEEMTERQAQHLDVANRLSGNFTMAQFRRLICNSFHNVLPTQLCRMSSAAIGTSQPKKDVRGF